jgi:prepilin-type N-terminal cleavage/methylation domain-containing protein
VKRRGFSLIEMVISLGVIGVLVAAMGSSVVLATRTLPDAGSGSDASITIARTLDAIRSDLRTAKLAQLLDTGTLAISVPDRTGDEVDDLIIYEWDGIAGDPLTRRVGTEAAVSLIASATLVEFTPITGTGSAQARMSCRIVVGGIEMTAEQRTLNIEAGP